MTSSKQRQYAYGFATAVACLLLSQPAYAQSDPIKIGFIAGYTGGAGAAGMELRNGFDLGVAESGGKLGGRAAQVIYGDDNFKPDIGRQLADKMIESDRVHLLAGMMFTAVTLAVIKPAFDAGIPVLSVNTGPAQLAGKGCSPLFYNVVNQNQQTAEAIGSLLESKGIKTVALVGIDNPAGKELIGGVKLGFKGKVLNEFYTSATQVDFSGEIAQIRASRPEATVIWIPGALSVNIIKQYNQAGLKAQIPIYTPANVIDQSSLPGLGDDALGITTAELYSTDLNNEENKKFMAAYRQKYNAVPSNSAAGAYDGARILNAALTAIGGKIEDKKAFRAAMEDVRINSVKGYVFKFNKQNHFPTPSIYQTRVEKNSAGQLVQSLVGTIGRDLHDSYASQCSFPAN